MASFQLDYNLSGFTKYTRIYSIGLMKQKYCSTEMVARV